MTFFLTRVKHREFSMENNTKEKQDQSSIEQKETPKQTVPAPIPEKSAWKVEASEKTTETVEIAGGI